MQRGWGYLHIFSSRSLKELVRLHGFCDVHVRGAGHYPFPARVGSWDPPHAAFIIATDWRAPTDATVRCERAEPVGRRR